MHRFFASSSLLALVAERALAIEFRPITDPIGFPITLGPTVPAPSCGGCNLDVAAPSVISFPGDVEFQTSTVTVIPYVTVYQNGTDHTVTNYVTITASNNDTAAAQIPTGTGHLTWTWNDATLTYPTTYAIYDPAAIQGGVQTGAVDASNSSRTYCVDTFATLPVLSDAPITKFIIPLPSKTAYAYFPAETASDNNKDDGDDDGDDYVTLPSQIINFLSSQPTYSAVFAGHNMHTCTTGTHWIPESAGHPNHQTQGVGPGGFPPPDIKSTVLVLQTSTNNPIVKTVTGGSPPTPLMDQGSPSPSPTSGGNGGGLAGLIASIAGGQPTQAASPNNGAGSPPPAVITPPPTFPPSLNVAGQTVTANSEGGFVVAPGTTLTAGGPAAVVAGSTISIGYSPSGGTIAVVNGQTSYLATTTGAAYLYGPGTLTINGQTYAPTVSGSSTWYVVQGTTITPGGVATIAGMSLSLAPGDSTLYINGQASTVSPAVTGVTGTPVEMFMGAGTTTGVNKLWMGLVALGTLLVLV